MNQHWKYLANDTLLVYQVSRRPMIHFRFLTIEVSQNIEMRTCVSKIL